ncbi:MAG: lysylphosphatidylglycerol synthase transmembrane domain-containing protein [Pseudomonadota bacterium]
MKKITYSQFKKFLFFALVLPILSLVFIFLFFSGKLSDYTLALESLGFSTIILLFLLASLDIFARAMRSKFGSIASGRNLSLKAAIKINLIGDFFCLISPGRVLGDPSRFFGFLKKGLKPGQAFYILAFEMIGDVIFLLLIFITPLFFNIFSILEKQGNETGFSYYFFLITLIVSIGLSFAPIVYLLVLSLPIKKLLKRKKVERFIINIGLEKEKIDEFIADIYKKLGSLKQIKLHQIFLTSICTIIFRLARLSILMLILHKMQGLDFSPLIYFWQFLFVNCMIVFPLPAGGGVVEGGLSFFLIAMLNIQKQIVPLIIFIWQFFISYIFAIIGGIIAFRTSFVYLFTRGQGNKENK